MPYDGNEFSDEDFSPAALASVKLRPKDDIRSKFYAAADRAKVPHEVADDFFEVTSGVESGNRHFTKGGHVLKSPVDPKDGQQAVGISQIKPGTAKKHGSYDLNDMDQNIEAGLKEFYSLDASDPVARRIGYFAGGASSALKHYRKTGQIPRGGDFTGTSFEEYVKKSKGKKPVASEFTDADFAPVSQSGPIVTSQAGIVPSDAPIVSREGETVPPTPTEPFTTPTYVGRKRRVGDDTVAPTEAGDPVTVTIPGAARSAFTLAMPGTPILKARKRAGTPTSAQGESLEDITVTLRDGLSLVGLNEDERQQRQRVEGIQHTVKKGDTVKSVAKKYGVKPEDLLNANGVTDPSEADKIQPGTVIQVPKAIPSTADRVKIVAAARRTKVSRPADIPKDIRDSFPAHLDWHLGMAPEEFAALSIDRQRAVAKGVIALVQIDKDKGGNVPRLSAEQKNHWRQSLGLGPAPHRYQETGVAGLDAVFGSKTNTVIDPTKPQPRPVIDRRANRPEFDFAPPNIATQMAGEYTDETLELLEATKGGKSPEQAISERGQQFGQEEEVAKQKLRERIRPQVTQQLDLARKLETDQARLMNQPPPTPYAEWSRRIEEETERQVQDQIGNRFASQVLAQEEIGDRNEVARQERVKNMGWGEFLTQIPKSLPVGFARAVSSTLKGVAASGRALGMGEGDVKDNRLYRLGDGILKATQSAVGSNPDLEKEFGVGQVPETVGQIATFLLGGWATKGSKLAISLLAGTQISGDAYDEIKSLGGSEEDAQIGALIAGGVLGPTELIGMRGALRALKGGARATTWKAALKTAAVEGRRDVVDNFLQEIGQEAGQGFITGQERTAQELFKAGALGAIGSGITTPAITLAQRAPLGGDGSDGGGGSAAPQAISPDVENQEVEPSKPDLRMVHDPRTKEHYQVLDEDPHGFLVMDAKGEQRFVVKSEMKEGQAPTPAEQDALIQDFVDAVIKGDNTEADRLTLEARDVGITSAQLLPPLKAALAELKAKPKPKPEPQPEQFTGDEIATGSKEQIEKYEGENRRRKQIEAQNAMRRAGDLKPESPAQEQPKTQEPRPIMLRVTPKREGTSAFYEKEDVSGYEYRGINEYDMLMLVNPKTGEIVYARDADVPKVMRDLWESQESPTQGQREPQNPSQSIGSVEFRQMIADAGGRMGDASDVFADRVKQHLADGGRVVLFADGKAIPIVSVNRGMMQDAQGHRWGTMGIATAKTNANRVDLYAPESQPAQPEGAEKPKPSTQETKPEKAEKLDTGVVPKNVAKRARKILDGYEDTGELTEMDVVDKLEQHGLLPDGVSAFRAAQVEDLELGQRMGVPGETFERSVLPALRRLAKGAPSPVAKESKPEASATVDVSPILAADAQDYLGIGGRMMREADSNVDLAAIQKAIQQRGRELEAEASIKTQAPKAEMQNREPGEKIDKPSYRYSTPEPYGSEIGYRVDSGSLSNREKRSMTAADIVRFEREENGNDEVDPKLDALLAKVPASDISWVTKTPEDASRYASLDNIADAHKDNPAAMEQVQQVNVNKDSVIIAEDGDGGYLVIQNASKHGLTAKEKDAKLSEDEVPVPGEADEAQGAGEAESKRGRGKVPESRPPSGRSSEGAQTKVRVAGLDVDAQYGLREAADVYPSHDPQTFAPNSNYEHKNDRRYDKEPQYQIQVIDRSKPGQFDPSQVINNASSYNVGPPLIDRNGNVLGGNSRSMMIKRLYEAGNGEVYKSKLMQDADIYGLDREEIEGMEAPILVRYFSDTPDDIQKMIADLNVPDTTPLTPSEKGISIAKSISPDTLQYIADKFNELEADSSLIDVLNKFGTDIVNRLVKDGALSPGDRNTLLDDGKVTPEGKQALAQTFRGLVFRDIEQIESAAKSVVKTVDRIVTPVMLTSVDPEWSILDRLRDTFDLLQDANAAGVGPASSDVDFDDFLRQGTLVQSEPWPEDVASLARTLRLNPTAAAKKFKAYANEYQNVETGSLLGVMSPSDAFDVFFGDKVDVEPIEMFSGFPFLRKLFSGRSRNVTVNAALESESAEVEKRWNEAKGIQAPGMIGKAKDALIDLKNAFKRHFTHLDPNKDAQTALTVNVLLQYEASPAWATAVALDNIAEISGNLDRKAMDVFNRNLALPDMLKEIEAGRYKDQPIEFGYESKAQVERDLAKFQAVLKDNPAIRAALSRRATIVRNLTQKLIDLNLVDAEEAADPRYYHRQVMARINDPITGTPNRDARMKTKGFQIARTGGGDFNTLYQEAEFEWMRDALTLIAQRETLDRLDGIANIRPEMMKQSELWNEANPAQPKTTWDEFIPETHTPWQPKKGNDFFLSANAREAMLDRSILGELSGAEARELFPGGMFDNAWVIPKELALTLDEFQPPVQADPLEKLWTGAIATWKQWKLLNPFGILRYKFNNASGDLDVSTAYSPKIGTVYQFAAARDLWRYHVTEKAPSEVKSEIQDKIRKGLLNSGMTITEIPEINKEGAFRALTSKDPNLVQQLVQQYWGATKNFNNWSENILRLAAYRYFKTRVAKSDHVYAASSRKQIDAIDDPDDRAVRLALDLIGNYGNVSSAGIWLRSHLVPFWSFQEINSPRYVRLFANLPYEGDASGEGKGRAGRAAAAVGKRVAMKAPKLLLYMHILTAMTALWNHLMFPEEEKELRKEGRKNHIILGRTEDGAIQSVRAEGALMDALSWGGLEDWPADVRDLMSGRATFQDKAAEAVKAPIEKTVNMLEPFTKTTFEVAMGKSAYPRIFERGSSFKIKTRPIRDRMEYAAQVVSLERVYRLVTGKPAPPSAIDGIPGSVASLLVYRTDPGEAAYWDIKETVSKWRDSKGKESPSMEPTDKSTALYYFKSAVKWGDEKAAKKWLEEYVRLGGTPDGMEKSIKIGHPLGSIAKRDWKEFLDDIKAEDQEALGQALEWYDKTYGSMAEMPMNLKEIEAKAKSAEKKDKTRKKPTPKKATSQTFKHYDIEPRPRATP